MKREKIQHEMLKIIIYEKTDMMKFIKILNVATKRVRLIGDVGMLRF